MESTFKLFEFNVINKKPEEYSNKDGNKFAIQMFGINENGEKASIMVEEYEPFFYVKVNDNWNQNMKRTFIAHLKEK